jgi:hypothetical protein
MTWPYREELDDAARLAAHALEDVRLSIKDGTLRTEPEMNGAFVSQLATAFRKHRSPGIIWSCRHLLSTRKNQDENLVGADLVIAVNIDLPGFKQEKGLLIQNKRSGTKYNKELLGQVDKMEKFSDSAWLGVLGKDSIRFDSARSVRARGGAYSSALARIPAFTFFRDFFQCEIGDQNLTPRRAADIFKEADEAGPDTLIVEASAPR